MLQQTKPNYSLIVAPILAGICAIVLFIWYNSAFSSRYHDIMSETSMKDDTQTLTDRERRDIREVMNTLFTDAGLRVSFHIAHENAVPQNVGENTLRIGIEIENNEVFYVFPTRLRDALNVEEEVVEQQFINHFNQCLTNPEELSLGECLTNNLQFIRNEIYVKRAIVLPQR